MPKCGLLEARVTYLSTATLLLACAHEQKGISAHFEAIVMIPCNIPFSPYRVAVALTTSRKSHQLPSECYISPS